MDSDTKRVTPDSSASDLAAPAVDAAKLDDLGMLKALAEAAEKDGQHIYTHYRDSNKAADNASWHRVAKPEIFLSLLAQVEQQSSLVAQQAARIAELEAREWISVDERLPEHRQSVTFVAQCESGSFKHLHRRVLGGTYVAEQGFGVPGLTIGASHWMPSPAAPTATKEGK